MFENLKNKETFWEDVKQMIGFYDGKEWEDWQIKRMQREADARYAELCEKRWNIAGFYGEYGKICEREDKSAYIEIIMNNGHICREYKNLRAAKIAVSKLLDSYTLKEARV